MTDRLRTAPLDTEHLVFIDGDHPEQAPVPRPVKELYEEGYPVEVLGCHPVVNDKPDEDSSAYLVVEVETTSVPLEDADYERDKMSLFACPCWDYVARRSPFAEEHDGPRDATSCKHVERVERRQHVSVDDGQETLV